MRPAGRREARLRRKVRRLRAKLADTTSKLREVLAAQGARPPHTGAMEPETLDPAHALTSEEATTMLRLPSVRAFYQLARRRQLTKYGTGRRLLFDRREIEALIRRVR